MLVRVFPPSRETETLRCTRRTPRHSSWRERTMSWNRTGGTLMQSSGEFRLSEPRSTALIEAATRADRSGVFILIGQGSWVEQCDAMSENGAFGSRAGQSTLARWLELPRLTRRYRGLRPFCPPARTGLVSHAGGTRPGTRRCSDWPVTATSQVSGVSCRWARTLRPETWCASTDYNGCADPMYHAHTRGSITETCPCVHTPCLHAARQHGHDARCGEEPIPRHRGIAGCAR